MSSTNLEYKEAMNRLEEILTKIDASEMGIDELATQVKEATELLKTCRRVLVKTEESVQKSLESLDSEMEKDA